MRPFPEEVWMHHISPNLTICSPTTVETDRGGNPETSSPPPPAPQGLAQQPLVVLTHVARRVVPHLHPCSHLLMRIFLPTVLLQAAMTFAYVPQRTPQRDRIFFGIEGASGNTPVTSVSVPPVRLPPASSQIGVNRTATTDADLNDYGSLGVPDEIKARRAEASAAGVSVAQFIFFQTDLKSESGMAIVKHVLNGLSVVWLVLLVVGCFFFLRTAIQGANRKVSFASNAALYKEKSIKENSRIDREAYVYVDGG